MITLVKLFLFTILFLRAKPSMPIKFTDLVDIEKLKKTCTLFAQLTGFTVALGTHPEQDILFLLGSRDICKFYHRKYNRTNTFCIASNSKLTHELTQPGQIAINYCANGLIDGATPVYVDGEHLANLFSGQVFFTEPDIAFFERQAKKCGFDKKEYMEALKKVPIVKEEDFRLCLSYLTQMASNMAEVGIINKKLKEKELLLEQTNIDLQAQQQIIFDNSPNIVSLKDIDSKYLLVNKAFAKFFNKTPSELIGKTDFDCFPKNIAEKYLKEDQEILKTGQHKVYEEYLENLDGQKLCTETFKTPIYSTDNTLTGTLAVSNDITRQKKTEEALKETKVRYKGLFSNINSSLIVFSVDKQNQKLIFKDVNKNFEILSKHTKQELIGKDIYEVFPVAKESPFFNGINKVIETQTPEYLDDFYYSDPNFKGWLSCQIYNLPGEEICLLINDVTRVKKAEEDLRLTNFSLDAADYQIYWVNPDGTIARVNQAVCDTLGYSKEELSQMHVSDFNPLYKNNKWPTIWKSIKEAGLKRYESTHIRKDGREYPVEISPNYFEFEGKEYNVTFIVDISERKELEKALNKKQCDLENMVNDKTKELQLSLKELEKMNLFLQEANNHKNRFLSAMSHELRTPLNAILGFSSTLKMTYYGELNDKQSEYIDLINDSGRHLLSLIDEVLDITKIDSGVVELKFGSIEINSFIEGIIEKMTISFYEKAIKIESNFDPNIDFIIADPGKLKQILKNILSNALKFTPKDGKVIVTTEKLDDKIKISIKDNGVGIPETEQEKIFTEFYKTNEARTQAVGGTGIGLCLTKRLVEMHKGEVGVESTYGVGSEFWILLPITQETS